MLAFFMLKYMYIKFKKNIEKFQFGGVTSGTLSGVIPTTNFEVRKNESYKDVLGDEAFTPYQSKAPQVPQLDTETLNKLAGKGHTNAANQIIGTAQKAQQLLQAGMSKNPNYIYTEEGKALMQQMTVPPQMLNELERDLKNTEDLRKAAEKNNSGSELAVSKEGKILAKDKQGKVVEISPGDYFTGAYIPLSITDLLYEKDRNPSLTFTNVSKYSDAITGFENAQKHVREMFSNVGEYGFKNSNEAFQAMDNAIMKISQSGGNINNLKQVDARLEAMMQTLPEQVRNNFLMRAMVNSKTPQEMRHNYMQGFLNYAKGVYTNKDESAKGIGFDAGLTKFTLGRDTKEEAPEYDFYYAFGNNTGSVQGQEMIIPNVTKPQGQNNIGVPLNERSERKAVVTTLPMNDDIRKKAELLQGKSLDQLQGRKVMWGGQEIDLSKMKDANKMLIVKGGEQVVKEADPKDLMNLQIQQKQEDLLRIQRVLELKANKGDKAAAQELPLVQQTLQELEKAKKQSLYFVYQVAAPSSAFSNNKSFSYYNDQEGKLEPVVGGFGESIKRTDLVTDADNTEAAKTYEEKVGSVGFTDNVYTTTVYLKDDNFQYADDWSARKQYAPANEAYNQIRERVNKILNGTASAQKPYKVE